jgi:hypothetical protein
MKLCLTTLHRPIHSHCYAYDSCAASLLSILLRKSIAQVDRMVLRRRRRLKYRGVLKHAEYRNQCVETLKGIDWREIVGIIRKAKPNVRSRPGPRCTVLNFAKRVQDKRKYTYVLRIKDHVLLVRYGMIYDNYSDGEDPHTYQWRNCRVLDYCVLRNPRGAKGKLPSPEKPQSMDVWQWHNLGPYRITPNP